jgi:ATP-dependent DNA helicase RecG
LQKKLIEKRGKTNAIYYILSKDYYDFTDEKAKYYNLQELDDNQVFTMIMRYLSKEKTAKMKDFIDLIDAKLTRKQVRLKIEKLLENKILILKGEGINSYYEATSNYIEGMSFIAEIIDIGRSFLNQNEKTNKGPKKDQ